MMKRWDVAWKIPFALTAIPIALAYGGVVVEMDSVTDQPAAPESTPVGMALQPAANDSVNLSTVLRQEPYKSLGSTQLLASPQTRSSTLAQATPLIDNEGAEQLARKAERHAQRGELELAAANAWLAARKEPTLNHAFLLARMLMECRDYDNAIALFMKIKEREKHYPEVAYYIGESYFLSGEPIRAEPWFVQAQSTSAGHQEIIKERLEALRNTSAAP